MPTFCRHNRFEANCPICRAPEPPASARRVPRTSASAGTATRPRAGASSPRKPSGAVRVRRVARAADDGYANALVPGIRASADALRLAVEIAFSTGRLAVLAGSPPGAYAEAASEPDREEGLWLAVLTAVLGPLEGDDAFAAIRAARVPWSSGETPALDGAALGPRGAASPPDAQRALAAYRAWAGRAGSQEAALRGEPGWTPERRFDRTFERLGTLPGFARPARYDLLVTLGRLGLLDVRASQLHVASSDDTSLAAKRVFGIGDRFLLERRAAELADAAAVPIEALDLALANWGSDHARATQGAPDDAADGAVGDRAAAALGVAEASG
jgi:hypothetical protein